MKLWDVKSGVELVTYEGQDIVSDAVFSPDGKALASGEFDIENKSGIIRLWRAATDGEVARQRNR